MRNPKWHRDEIILALDLYFRLEPGQVHAGNPEVIELSKLLNILPIHETKPDQEKFRNPNGVSLKLSNFLAIDPNHIGKGMSSYSVLDKQVFFEFNEDRNLLKQIANNISDAVVNLTLNEQLNNIHDEPEDLDVSVKEGKVLYKLHKYRERNRTIINKKKAIHFKKFGNLACEACGFDFEKNYGNLGSMFIECHHKTPLSELEANTETKLDDLALVCSNCHRMLHVDSNLKVEDLKKLLI